MTLLYFNGKVFNIHANSSLYELNAGIFAYSRYSSNTVIPAFYGLSASYNAEHFLQQNFLNPISLSMNYFGLSIFLPHEEF